MAKKPTFNTRIEFKSFPHHSMNGKLLATTANLQHLLNEYGITVGYDVVLKEQVITLENAKDSDLKSVATFAHIRSLAALNELPLGAIDLLPALFEQKQLNPITDWITSVKWDKKDHFNALLNTLQLTESTPENERYKELALRTWLIQCVAAVDYAKHAGNKKGRTKFELVFVLQGAQGAQKTTWFKSLVPRDLTRYVVDGAHLDPADKDTVVKCTSSWICELGELDSTFRRADIARLKAFLSSEVDVMRLPYDRVTSTFSRRTSFGASVNPDEFLSDSTGARRFLPVQVLQCADHEIDTQQLWAQVWHWYTKEKAQWWCDTELETLLEKHHELHTETNAVDLMIADKYDLVDRTNQVGGFEHLTITQILSNVGIDKPSKEQLRHTKAILARKGFKQCQVSGTRGYYIREKGKGLIIQPSGKLPKEQSNAEWLAEFDGLK